jgi:hypothetical protein
MKKLRFSLYGKLLLLAGILGTILIFILFFSASGFKVLNNRDIVRYAETIMIESYHLRTEFSKKKDLTYQKRFLNNISKIDSLLNPLENEQKIQDLLILIKEYSSNYEEYVELMKQRGLNENLGVEGKFRKAVHNIEDLYRYASGKKTRKRLYNETKI